MDENEARERLSAAPVARLGTVDPEGVHLVPCTFAVEGDTLVTAVDHKPKRSTALRRLDNVRRDPRVTLLADHYEDDWSVLWWVRVRGTGVVVEGGEAHERAVGWLAAKYQQYRDRPPAGPVIQLSIEQWRWWSAR